MTAIVCSVNVNGYINITTWIFICAMINTTINKHHMFETVIPCFNQSMLIVVFDHNFFFLKKWTPSTSVKSLVLLVFNIVYIILITSTCYRYVKLFFDSTTSLDYRKSPLQCYLSKTPSDYIGDSTFPVRILHIYPNCGNLALLGFWFYSEEVLGNHNLFDVLNSRQFYDRGIKKKYNFIITKIFFVYPSSF